MDEYDDFVAEFLKRKGRLPGENDWGQVSPFDIMFGQTWEIDDSSPERIEGAEELMATAYEMSEEMPQTYIQMISGANVYYFLNGQLIPRSIEKELDDIHDQHRLMCAYLLGLYRTLRKAIDQTSLTPLQAYIPSMFKGRGKIQYPFYRKLYDEWIDVADSIVDSSNALQLVKQAYNELDEQLDALGHGKVWLG